MAALASTSSNGTPPPPPSLQEATKSSTLVWQGHLEELFRRAKDRFPDVVWELLSEEEEVVEEVWGHKAIVYARAPPSFQSRYFSFRPIAQQGFESAVSLDASLADRSNSPARGSSPTSGNPPSTILRLSTSISPALFSNELEYLYTGKGFGEAFEFLFDTTETRAEQDEQDGEALRIDKLRKDLVFMWRSRLYSDVRLCLTGNFGSAGETTAIFSSHRFVLVSRSNYFHTALLAWPQKSQPGEPPTLNLPSPPFTPASLHFTLGFIYTGTLIFSHRSYDLSTAFGILRAALYLSLPTLHDEIQARIAQEMCHGLFHAFITFAEYESLTGGKWGTGGCRCRQCARRAPRVLEFATSVDVKNVLLERGARRALVGMFGEGWCSPEFAELSPKLREGILKGVAKRTTVINVLPLLWAVEHGMAKMANVIDAWGDTVREMMTNARRVIDDVLCSKLDVVFDTSSDWEEIMKSDGVGFEDRERIEWVMAAILRGLKETNAPGVYQALLSSVILKSKEDDDREAMLSPTSGVRALVEQTREDVGKWMSKRWLGIRAERGFDSLDGWVMKEISDQIQVPVEDLLNPPPSYASRKSYAPGYTHSPRTSSAHPHTSRVDVDSESSIRASISSRRPASVRSVSTVKTVSGGVSAARRIADDVRARDSKAERPDSKFGDEGAETSSLASSLFSDSSTATGGERKKTLITRASVASAASRVSAAPTRKTSAPSSSGRPSSPGGASVKSKASTIRKSSVPSTSSARLPVPLPATPSRSNSRLSVNTTSTRPVSSLSTLSTKTTSTTRTTSTTGRTEDSGATSTYRTASGGGLTPGGASRRTSAASTKNSPASVRTASGGSIRSPSSARSVSGGARSTAGSPVRERKLSTATVSSVRSVKSTTGTPKKTPTPTVKKSPVDTKRKVVVKKKSEAKQPEPKPEEDVDRDDEGDRTIEDITIIPASDIGNTSSTMTVRPSSLIDQHRKTDSTTSVATLKRRGSDATIKSGEGILREAISIPSLISEVPIPPVSVTPPAPAPPPVLRPVSPPASMATPTTTSLDITTDTLSFTLPRGATLEIGIPCIISSKRKRFKAYARYIGEVEGETGPWVGVEVPVPVGDTPQWDSAASVLSDDRVWHDGSWGGIRYFEMSGGVGGSEYEYGEERVSRRRKMDGVSGGSSTLKRERSILNDVASLKRMRSQSPTEDTLVESRGLFVRPQQVIYVVDAVGADL